MQVTYQKWLEIEVQNKYFKDGLCPVIRFEPFAETAKIFNTNKIVTRKNGALLSFYVGLQSTDTQTLFDKLAGIESLYFKIWVEDPLFYNYTDLPDVPENTVLLFANNEGDTSLQKNKTVSVADCVSVKQEHLGLLRPKEGDIIQIKDSSGGRILQQTKYGSNSIVEVTDYPPVNLAKLPTNRYELWVNNQRVGDPFYHFDTLITDNCLGIAKIDMASIVNDANPDLKLTLGLKVRNVYRKYKIIIPSNRGVSVEIVSVNEALTTLLPEGEKPPAYKEEESVRVANNNARVFVSPVLEELKEHLEKPPTVTISYQDPASNSITRTEDIILPNPSAEQLEQYVAPDDSKALCATTIVYV